MTIDEVIEKYKIPLHILKEYERWGLCGEVKKVMETWQYDDTDLERLSMIITLHEIGFENSEVETYMRLMVQGKSTEIERMKILNKKRNSTLEEIHFKEKQLDTLDYLRNEIRKNQKSK